MLTQIKTALFKRNNSSRKISYSQSGEDLIVDFIFTNILKKPVFSYLDVGAHHPFFLSNTAIFYQRGYKGISIEPDPTLYNLIKKSRPKETCLNIGIGFTDESLVNSELPFYIMTSPTLNTFSKAEAEKLHNEGVYKISKIQNIQVCHLHRIFKDYFVPDFISIDIEGIDLQVIRSIDFKRFRPKVICVETLFFSSKESENVKNDPLIDFLKKEGYFLYADTNINSIFIDSKILNYAR